MNERGFQRVVAIHAPGQPWRDLTNYAGMLASGSDGDLGAVIEAPPSRTLETALDAASRYEADLLVMRHPRVSGHGRGFARRLLRGAPCSVCFVPQEAPPRAERILAGIDLNSAGRALLSRATDLYRDLSAEELIAVHCCFLETTAIDESLQEYSRFERTMDLFHFMSRAELNGVACTPVLGEGATAHTALARVVKEQGADLVVVGREPGGRANIMRDLLWTCTSPAVQLLLPDPSDASFTERLGRNLRRIFSNPEPMFN